MPITASLGDHDLYGPIYEKGYQQGRRAGVLKLLRLLLAKRFGPIPPSLDYRLAHLTESELLDLGDRILDVPGLKELLNP